MRIMTAWILLVVAAAPAIAQDAAKDSVAKENAKLAATANVWHNPSNSVHVRTEACGASLCGVIVWANDKAKADAKRGGTDPLIGTTLFRDFTSDGPDRWRGQVFVPDIRRTFSGTITRVDATTITGRGCLVGRVGCRSQTWTLVPVKDRKS